VTTAAVVVSITVVVMDVVEIDIGVDVNDTVGVDTAVSVTWVLTTVKALPNSIPSCAAMRKIV